MKKLLLVPVLAGGIFALLTSEASAAIITYTTSVPFTNTDWEFPDTSPPTPPLSFPKYNPALYGGRPLQSVRIEAIAETRGSYFLRNDNPSSGPPNRLIRYGTFSDQVGATVNIDAPNFSIFLSPVPVTHIGSGTLTPQQSINPSLNGRDTSLFNITSTDPNFTNYIYTGTGSSNVILNSVVASSLINVSKLGTPFTETATVQASLTLNATYTIPDVPPATEIPEPDFGLIGVAFCGLVGLALKGLRRGGDE